MSNHEKAIRDPGDGPRVEDYHYTISVTAKCAQITCGRKFGNSDPRSVKAALEGRGLTIRCPECGDETPRTPRAEKERSRITIARAMPKRGRR